MRRLFARGRWDISCRAPDGILAWERRVPNLITTAGLNKVLTEALKGSSYTASWRAGLVDAAGFTAYAAGDTLASHVGWSEFDDYSGTRKALTFGAVSGGSVQSDSVQFTATTPGTIRGIFVCDAESGTSGTLLSEADFAGGLAPVGVGYTVTAAYEVTLSSAVDAWTNPLQFLATSSGSRSLGNNSAAFNSTRDTGSKIVFFDDDDGDNATAGVYWWNGTAIVDSTGSTSGVGGAYGTSPLEPNEAAIKPFKDFRGAAGNADSDNRLRSHNQDFACVAKGYPDWFLFRRGQTHTIFDGFLDGGRSAAEPMVVASYGPVSDTRAIIDPAGGTVIYGGDDRPGVNPFGAGTSGLDEVWEHQVILGLEFTEGIQHLGAEDATTLAIGGGPVTMLLEDCRLTSAGLVYLPSSSTIRRCSIAFRWDADAHNQGYYTQGLAAQATFEDSFFYRNGYKTDPRALPDPKRDNFSRNVYEGGGAQMGHTYTNVMFCDGASGSPQMRLGGKIEKSLICEGYWFSHTNSNTANNTWLTAGPQSGQSAWVKDNVQLVYKYPNAEDPDSVGDSDVTAQPGSGYSLMGASFGAIVEDNIVTLAMLIDDLGAAEHSTASGYSLTPSRQTYQDAQTYTLKDSTVRRNIAYRTNAGLGLQDNWTDAAGMIVEENVFVANTPVSNGSTNLSTSGQLTVRTNRFYANNALPSGSWMGAGNTLDDYADAATAESWPDPDRTLRRYLVEVCGLTLLDWADDPWVTAGSQSATAYDPAGFKTFMAVATNMRRGGVTPAPSSGKPSWTGDYEWDDRFTAQAVVDWIRAGFGMAPTV